MRSLTSVSLRFSVDCGRLAEAECFSCFFFLFFFFFFFSLSPSLLGPRDIEVFFLVS